MGSSSRDWMFCPVTGQLLDFDAPRNIAFCPLSGKEKSLADFGKIKVISKTNISDYRTRYNLDPLVKGKVEKELEVEATRQRAVVDEECPKCGKQGVEFFTMQLRSADEGSTVFYECKECGYKWSQNN